MDPYFTNKLIIKGKLKSIIESKEEATAITIETREVWPDGHVRLEIHQARLSKAASTQLSSEGLDVGEIIEIEGRLRAEPEAVEYAPYIHVLNLTKADVTPKM